MNNEEFLNLLNIYTIEKLNFISSKFCNNCDEEKKFYENNNHLIFSCGDDKINDCGNQIEINLPLYTNFNDLLDIFKKNKDSLINWKILNNYTENKENFDNFTNINNDFNEINIKYNDTKKILNQQNINIIDKLYNNHIKLSKELNILYKNLNNSDLNLDDDEKKTLRIKYIHLKKELSNNYLLINDHFKNSEIKYIYNSLDCYKTKEGNAKEINNNYKSLTKKSKKKSKKK